MAQDFYLKEFMKLYGVEAETAVYLALEACREVPGAVLHLSEGLYDIRGERLFESYYAISNNDKGRKRILFPLIGFQDLTIDGGGAELLFHDRVLPFVIDRSSGICIKNFSMDYRHPFYASGEIVGSDMETADVRISEEFPYRIEDGRIIFYSEDWENDRGMEQFLELDPQTHLPAYQIGDDYVQPGSVTAEELGDRVVRFHGKFIREHTVGNLVVLQHEGRNNPGILITESRNVRLEQIDIYHADAMAVIAQISEDISLERVNVLIRPGSGRVVSALADATHFVNCSGTVRLENCTLESQLDDPFNVHGNYTTAERVYGDYLEVKIHHPQQWGVNILRPGDEVQVIGQDTLVPYLTAAVTESVMIHESLIRLKLDRPVQGLRANDVVENISRMPEVEIRNCRCGKNRARGFLISTPKRVVIENNVLYPAGAGISIAGDAIYWYESGAVRDVTIRGNQFVDCWYGPWERGIIDAAPRIKQFDGRCFHRNIVIDHNTFVTFEETVVSADSVDGLEFTNNTIQKSDTYPACRPGGKTCKLRVCKNVKVEGNRKIGFADEEITVENQQDVKEWY